MIILQTSYMFNSEIFPSADFFFSAACFLGYFVIFLIIGLCFLDVYLLEFFEVWGWN